MKSNVLTLFIHSHNIRKTSYSKLFSCDFVVSKEYCQDLVETLTVYDELQSVMKKKPFEMGVSHRFILKHVGCNIILYQGDFKCTKGYQSSH